MRLTKTQRIARDRLVTNAMHLAADSVIDRFLESQVPDAWHTLEHDIDLPEKKVEITLQLDASVAKLFQAMGDGYQDRINRILATWVQMKILNLVETERKADAD